MNWRVFLFDVPISIITVALAAQLTTHYDLVRDWHAALATVGLGTLARLMPEALTMLQMYRDKFAQPPPLIQPMPPAGGIPPGGTP